MMQLTKSTLFSCLILFSIHGHGQINTSQAGNYQAQKTSVHNYASNYQRGYVQLLDGTRLDGEISIIGHSYDRLYGLNLKLANGEKYKFHMRSLTEFGLSDNLTNDTPGEFSWWTIDKVKLGSNTGTPPKPSNTRKAVADYGYVVTKDGRVYHGKLTLKEVRKKVTQIDLKTRDKQKLKFESSQLTNFGLGQRQVNQSASQKAELTGDNSKASYDALDAVSLSEVNENINGYVITSSGEKVEGKVAIAEFPGIWFVRDITLTTPDGEVNYYTNNGALKRVVFSKNGEIREYINYENEYVRTLDRAGSLIHFRNPHPTTLSTGGELASVLAGAAMESADQELRAAGGSVTKTSRPNEDTDWTSEEVIKLYAKEYLVRDEKTGRTVVYIPGKNYNQVEGELMGSIHFLKLPKEGKDPLRKMEKPLRTMEYMNRMIYNK